MRDDNCNCNPYSAEPNRFEGRVYPDCMRPVKKYLEPVLVARIYSQPIVEELPYYSESMTLNNTVTITEAHTNVVPLCGDCGCNDGCNAIG